MLKLWQKLFPPKTLAEKIEQALIEQREVVVNQDLTALYHAHKREFEIAKLRLLREIYDSAKEKGY